MHKKLKVCLTGGGTAGHVTPHFALLPYMRSRGWQCFYIGSKGFEKSLVEAQGLKFYTIATGKLRRYITVKNIFDVFRVGFGCLQALAILAQQRPAVVFSKGGFVSVPVCIAAWVLRIPVISHESDLTPGLATRIIARFARQIVYTFPDTARFLPSGAKHVGTPVRDELFTGDRERGLALCGFDSKEPLPTLLVMGGSQGAQRLNDALLEILPRLVKNWRVVHLTGKGKALAFEHPHYKGFEYVDKEFKDLLAAADFAVSRAGANSIFEILALQKPMLLIPLEIGSRGDQVQNAASFAEKGWATVLREKELNASSFEDAIAALQNAGKTITAQQQTFTARDAAPRILELLDKAAAG